MLIEALILEDIVTVADIVQTTYIRATKACAIIVITQVGAAYAP